MAGNPIGNTTTLPSILRGWLKEKKKNKEDILMGWLIVTPDFYIFSSLCAGIFNSGNNCSYCNFIFKIQFNPIYLNADWILSSFFTAHIISRNMK